MGGMTGGAQYVDGYWWSAEGLRLHYRDYPGPANRPALVCVPGLTRNARDFEPLVAHLAGQFRIIAIELRGRGESAYAKDPMSYVPLTYWQDLERLFDELKLRRFAMIGTSLGGLVAMLIAAHGSERLAGVVLNDIGPEIEAAGLQRIRAYAGKGGAWPTWMHAARALAETNAAVYPHYGVADWLAMAKRLYRLTAQGRITIDYDARIAEPFRLPGGEAPADLWPVLDALKDTPVLILRGALSDILSEATADGMKARLAKAKLVTVANVGHAPVLDEPEALAAIQAFLKPLAA
jgi:pimeloyl-ACP methyl ester carboxylesterase